MAASYIFGKEAEHGLEDAFRIWLSNNQEEYIKIKRLQASSKNLSSIPLSTSYIVNGKKRKRYDHVLISKNWGVNNIEYRYEEALKYGSDHAVVIVDLEKQNDFQTQ